MLSVVAISSITTPVATAASVPGGTPAQARAALVAAQLEPVPLYPSYLPARLRNAGTQLEVEDPYYQVSWNRRHADGEYGGSISFARGPDTDLDEAVAVVEARGGPAVTQDVLGGRQVLFLCGHICGYYWREGEFTFHVAGQYFRPPAGDDRTDMRSIVRSLQPLTHPWPYPLDRPVASADAQAFMPLLFLDDDEHWPLSNPDWFLHNADVRQCPKGDESGCRPVSLASMQDPALTTLRFDRDDHRTDAPPVMFVNQVEPGQPAVEGGPAISSVYRFFDYWWYYSFNRGPYGVTKFDHLSDWEGATVVSTSAPAIAQATSAPVAPIVSCVTFFMLRMVQHTPDTTLAPTNARRCTAPAGRAHVVTIGRSAACDNVSRQSR